MSKVMWFGKKQQHNKDIITLDGAIIEVVSSYKYLRIWLDSSLTFTTHITILQKKVKSILSFFIRNRSVFTTPAKKHLVETTILPLFDYGDVIYRNAHKGVLE